MLGEEEDTVTVKGEKVPIQLSGSESDTHRMLSGILHNDERAAAALAAAVHQPVVMGKDPRLADIGLLEVNAEDVAVWIDPIGEKRITWYNCYIAETDNLYCCFCRQHRSLCSWPYWKSE